jgi:hypothetical protein
MNKSTWEKWSSISEVLSSLAIVVTLIFLFVQASQNTDAINAQLIANRAESRAAIFELVSQAVEQTVEHPDISVSLHSTGPLTPEAEAKMDNWLTGFWAAREFLWLQYQDGVIDQATFESIIDGGGILALPRVSDWWDRSAAMLYDPDFVRLINTRYRA